ncbi:MAG: 5-methyltetrahydropteroyltriglutamate--homocysteine S-methyltransferase [Treponema sp.]|nr:5-methyltetrahydropteroyltriglutamate--homocysteine S-methyltransferase [Treponema sp.]
MSNYKTFVIGFPRIGAKRELKFAEEKYFAKEISCEELESCAKALREYGWKKQSAAKIDFIPSNDFSYYDAMLDVAVMLGAIPSRYKSLGLNTLDTYFAMAHGYQGEQGDVKALPMKKWFNTNYHYIVPELEQDTKISLNAEKILAEFSEAKAMGIETVPSVIGPYTFLHFATYAQRKSRGDYAEDICAAYKKLLEEASAAGAKWISICEPALVFDTDSSDVKFFESLYGKILNGKKIKVLLQTYFGDIRDSYDAVTALPFDGFGLDFVEGKETLSLVKKSFPKNALLFAGIATGKNIWRANYAKAASLLSEIEKSVPRENIAAGFSCSLLHVPYTTRNEEKLSAEIIKHFSFAEEKLSELSDIACGKTNSELFEKNRVSPNGDVQNALKNLRDADFVRKPDFAEREKIQKKEFNLPPFPTTTIGSFPQTREVRKNRADFKKGVITKEQYVEFNRKKIAECIRLQEELDIDVLVHGEFERNDMVEYFGNNLEGFLFTQNAWVQSYGTRCVKPPVIWGDVSRKNAITVEWSAYAQSLSKRPVKGMLTGPVTILNWSFPREDVPIKEQTLQIALAIRDEVLDLEKNGIRIIQIDEAALREKLPLRKSDWHSQYLDWAIPAFRLVHSGVKAETQIHTHMCYSEFNDIIRDIDEMDADVITFEASRSDLKILDALKEANFRTEVGPGVYDIHSPRIPSKEEIVSALEKMVQKEPVEKLWVNPDCGLKTRGDSETFESLKNLVAAAKEMRSKYDK